MDLDTRTRRLAALIEDRLGVRGSGYEAKLARAGRLLPRRVRTEAEYILLARRMQDNPKLAAQIDWARIDKSYATVERHLKAIDGWGRRQAAFGAWFSGNAINLVIVACLVLAALLWRGLI